jgi:3-oxoacyl-[acyl-carrier protein] reductase
MPAEPRTAIVTGASRGIGRAIVVALAAAGWRITAGFWTGLESVRETVRLGEEAGGKVIPIQADVSNPEGRSLLIDETLSAFERLDLLVNNAGVAPTVRADILETTPESYDQVMDVNLKGPFFLSQATAKTMIELNSKGSQIGGCLINIGSLSAYTASLNRGEYCISKAGLGMVTSLFAARLAEYGIQVFEVRPGIIETDMTGPVREKYTRLIEAGLLPIPRWGKPEDVAQAVLALARGSLPYSTGEVINVDGGFHIRRL